MLKLKNIIIFLIPILLIVISTNIKNAFAEDEFKTEYEIYYNINDNTEAEVTQNIKITNLKNDIIATNYSLSVKQMNIYDIKASDSKGEMKIVQETKEGTTEIIAYFNDTIIGKGRDNSFTFKYKTKDIAAKVGEIYSIKIPRVSGIENIREYKVILSVPLSFGPKIFITPKTVNEIFENNKVIYTFAKEDLENNGISANFGKYQLINYKLIYQIENPNFYALTSSIALPPDIKQRQQVNHKILNPQPDLIKEDEDGNLIAMYKLKAKQKLEIELIGTSKIMGVQINTELGGNFKDIPKNLIENYTKPQKYWEVNDPNIQTIKNRLYDADMNVSQNAYNVYKFVTENFKYDFEVSDKESVQRTGALSALQSKAPISCMEFTDLFIAITRAMGIPSRELNGYAINSFQEADLPLSVVINSSDLLHSWAEFYDPNFGWVPVDPTWGNTSKLDYFSRLDNSHFIFVTKGLNSEYPLPAGTYRFDGSKKLISVELSQNDDQNNFDYFPALYKTLNLNPIKIFQKYNKFYIYNEGGTYLYDFYGNKKILPYEIKTVYIPKAEQILKFNDINGSVIERTPTFLNKNPKKYLIHPLSIILSLILGTLLCSLFYYFLVLKGGLKKLSSHLHRRRLNPDRPHNRN